MEINGTVRIVPAQLKSVFSATISATQASGAFHLNKHFKRALSIGSIAAGISLKFELAHPGLKHREMSAHGTIAKVVTPNSQYLCVDRYRSRRPPRTPTAASLHMKR
ncbi:hypothetical protein [Stutzerimonas stutzeri]|uniref:hypothetical protein n=1 Tax=Stutzerimonas stutzeri TaxID=316 RepID=UPI0011AF284B|nr:hypothetical protein [Stutzerimonas stutzeri]MCQ4262107.1 hypothetical protein [Stutzerimonas stutzeri]